MHCQRGELPDVIRNYKFRNLDVDDFLEGAEKVPWFEVSARLVAVIEDFARRAEQQRQGMGYVEALEARLCHLGGVPQNGA